MAFSFSLLSRTGRFFGEFSGSFCDLLDRGEFLSGMQSSNSYRSFHVVSSANCPWEKKLK